MYYVVYGVVVVYFLGGATMEFRGKKTCLNTYLHVKILSSKSKSKIPLEPLEPHNSLIAPLIFLVQD